MPRGKRTNYAAFCGECAARTGLFKILKAKKADFKVPERFCKVCRKKTKMKLKEEKHSS